MKFVTQFSELFCHKIMQTFSISPVSTLRCETWNAHCAGATAEMSEKITPKHTGQTVEGSLC